jgi:hypothetical protein
VTVLAFIVVFAQVAKGAGIKQMGVGLAVAVLLDATLIRSVPLPAAMKLLGDENWYLPRWLEWLPRLTAEPELHEEVPESRPCRLMSKRGSPSRSATSLFPRTAPGARQRLPHK